MNVTVNVTLLAFVGSLLAREIELTKGGLLSTTMTTSLWLVPPAYVIVAFTPAPRKLVITPPSGSPANVPLIGSVSSLLMMTNALPSSGSKSLYWLRSSVTFEPIVTVPVTLSWS